MIGQSSLRLVYHCHLSVLLHIVLEEVEVVSVEVNQCLHLVTAKGAVVLGEEGRVVPVGGVLIFPLQYCT